MAEESGPRANESADATRNLPLESSPLAAKDRPGLWGLLLRLVIAHVGGLLATFAAFIILLCLVRIFSGPPVDLLSTASFRLACSVPGFPGGVIAGWALYDTVRDRRGRFFLLVIASPASSMWAILVLLILTGSEPNGWELLALALFCIAAGAGSLAGYRLGWRQDARNRRKEEASKNKGARLSALRGPTKRNTDGESGTPPEETDE